MLDSVAPSVLPAGRGASDKAGAESSAVASAGFAGLLNFESLPELPLQAHFPDVPSAAADGAEADLPTLDGDAANAPVSPELATEPSPNSAQHSAWLLVLAGGAAQAEPLSPQPGAAAADIELPVSSAIQTARSAELTSVTSVSAPVVPGQAPELSADAAPTVMASDVPAFDADVVQADSQVLTDDAGKGEALASSMNLPVSSANATAVSTEVNGSARAYGESPGNPALQTARSAELTSVTSVTSASAPVVPGHAPELSADAAPTVMASDAPPPDVDAVLADAGAVTDDASQGEALVKTTSLSLSSASSSAAPSITFAPATTVGGNTSPLLPTASPSSVPIADLAEHTLATIRHQGVDQAEVRMSLHPAELGALDLQIEQDGKRLELNITVDSDAARRAVNEHMASLRERLGEAGMQLARLDVSVRDQGQRQNADTPTPGAHSEPDESVNISPQRLIALPTDGLDLYA